MVQTSREDTAVFPIFQFIKKEEMIKSQKKLT